LVNWEGESETEWNITFSWNVVFSNESKDRFSKEIEKNIRLTALGVIWDSELLLSKTNLGVTFKVNFTNTEIGTYIIKYLKLFQKNFFKKKKLKIKLLLVQFVL